MTPKISVIVKMFNGEKTLKKCLDSLANQTYKNIEVLLINDGSTDNTRTIAESYTQKYSFFKLHNQENQGISSTGNVGLDIATGDYYIFFDQDDYAEPNAYERMVEFALINNADMVICDYKRTSGKENTGDFRTAGVYSRDEIYSHFLDDTITSHVWNKLCKNYLYDGIRFPKERKYDDMAISYKLAYRANRIVITNEKLFIYTDSDNKSSISFDNSTALRKDTDIAMSYRERYDFAISHNVQNLDHLLYQVALYNTNFYRNYHHHPDCEEQIGEITAFFKKNGNRFLHTKSVDLIRKFYIRKIMSK